MLMNLFNDRRFVHRRRAIRRLNYPIQAYPMFALNGYDAQVFPFELYFFQQLDFL